MTRTLGYFRADPEDSDKCQLVIAIDGIVHVIPWSRSACINGLRSLLSFVEKIPHCEKQP